MRGCAETGLQRGQQPDGHEPMAEERGKNLYDVLGLGGNTGCSADELKRAYRKTALRTHPDKKHEEDASPGEEGRGGPEGQQNEAFLEVQRAWAILSDPEERYRYDEELLRGGAGDELEDVVPDKVVTLSEMSHDRGQGSYGFECRCGDTFLIFENEKPESGTSVLLPCCSCSLVLCVNNE